MELSVLFLGKDFTTAGRILGLPHGRLHLPARPAGPRTSNPAGARIISNVDFSFKTSNCAPVYFPALPFSLPLSLCRGFISSPHLLSLGFLSLFPGGHFGHPNPLIWGSHESTPVGSKHKSIQVGVLSFFARRFDGFYSPSPLERAVIFLIFSDFLRGCILVEVIIKVILESRGRRKCR